MSYTPPSGILANLDNAALPYTTLPVGTAVNIVFSLDGTYYVLSKSDGMTFTSNTNNLNDLINFALQSLSDDSIFTDVLPLPIFNYFPVDGINFTDFLTNQANFPNQVGDGISFTDFLTNVVSFVLTSILDGMTFSDSTDWQEAISNCYSLIEGMTFADAMSHLCLIPPFVLTELMWCYANAICPKYHPPYGMINIWANPDILRYTYVPDSGTDVDIWWEDDPLSSFIRAGDGISFKDTISAFVNQLGQSLLSSSIFSDNVGFPTLRQLMPLFDGMTFNEVYYWTNQWGEIIVSWRGRTKNPLMGYGGMPYGDIGYGSGVATDIAGYRLQIWNGKKMIREVDFSIPDPTDPDIMYSYLKAANQLDNGGTFTRILTFYIYAIDSNGVLSVPESFTTK